LDDGKKAAQALADRRSKSLLLAPIEVKILVVRGSDYKIETDSGTNADKKAKISAPN
jgi:hypothetical protein